jgi:hypothetical protein
MRSCLTCLIYCHLGLATLPALAQSKPPPLPGPSIAELRDEARALARVQSLLAWYTLTVGEPSIVSETYKGHSELLSRRALDTIANELRAPTLSPVDRRALELLRSQLAVDIVAQRVAHFDDELRNAQQQTTTQLSWLDQPVPYKQLAAMAGDENDARRRAELYSARAALWRDSFNAILARREQAVQQTVRQLGYKSIAALSEEYRAVKLKPLIAEGNRFLLATDNIYKPLLTEISQRELKISVGKMRRGDIERLRRAPRFERFFPKELLLPTFCFFLSGIGLDLKTVVGSEIRIDDAAHPLKEPRTACAGLHVPDDVRISVRPRDGIDDFGSFFHQGGNAVRLANETVKVWELQQLGSSALGESLGELFGHVWDDPRWLKRYRSFVKQHNSDFKTSFPVMSDAEIIELTRVRILNDLLFSRRYASAKLIYESVLHGADPDSWRAVYPGPTADLLQLYRALFDRADGFAMSNDEALQFRADADDLFYAADYTRAFALASLIDEALRRQFGKSGDWYAEPRVGAFLKTLYADGNRLPADEIAKRLGAPALDLRPTEVRVTRLLNTR